MGVNIQAHCRALRPSNGGAVTAMDPVRDLLPAPAASSAVTAAPASAT